MESFEVKVAALSILALCVTAYLHFEPIWAWGFVLLIAIPLLVSRFPLIGYLFGAALLFLSAWLVSEGTTIYTLILGLAIAIYGFFLIKGAHSPIKTEKLTARNVISDSDSSSDEQKLIHLLEELKNERKDTSREPLHKTLLNLVTRLVDGVTLLVAGLISLPTFLALWYFDLKWPLILGLMTFMVYLWQVTRHPEKLSIKNPWDLRWHFLILCLCCLSWVLTLSVIPMNGLLTLNAHLPALLANPGWFEHGRLVTDYLHQLMTVITTGILLTLFVRVPTFLLLLLLGWLLYRFYISLTGNLQDRFNIVRWPLFSTMLILLMVWSDLENSHELLFEWIASYQTEVSLFVEIMIIGFIPWRIWKMLFSPATEKFASNNA